MYALLGAHIADLVMNWSEVGSNLTCTTWGREEAEDLLCHAGLFFPSLFAHVLSFLDALSMGSLWGLVHANVAGYGAFSLPTLWER